MIQQKTKQLPKNWEEIEKNGNKFYFEFEPGKEEKIKFIKNPKEPFVGNGGVFGIKVDKLFFEELNDKEKIAVLWHEYYHKLYNFKKMPMLELKSIFGLRFNYNYSLEFEADKFSALKNSANDCLSFLKTGKRLYNENKVRYNPKKHPSIKDRIKQIEEIKNDKPKD
ncbi:MAG: hypothetical protein KKC19_00785 [Nanoarchaeota archaeon]|nr:hypothetical protein [Nanoarchaeota archaeon]